MASPPRFPVPVDCVPWATDAPDYDPPLDDPDGAVPEGAALNPMGRTGLRGRGRLWKWGPNAAANMVLTRIGANARIEVLLIVRGDSGALALPGGFLEDGETYEAAAMREGCEEAVIPECLPIIAAVPSRKVQEGYSKSSRNTDHAWIVTESWHWHLAQEPGARIQLREAGDTDDAVHPHWEVVTPGLLANLFSAHRSAVQTALEGLGR